MPANYVQEPTILNGKKEKRKPKYIVKRKDKENNVPRGGDISKHWVSDIFHIQPQPSQKPSGIRIVKTPVHKSRAKGKKVNIQKPK
jgi:hypothetical protein